MIDNKHWVVTKEGTKHPEISVTYGGYGRGRGWADERKFIMPQANPGTEEQYAYFEKVAGLLAAVLNVNNVVPYKELETEDDS